MRNKVELWEMVLEEFTNPTRTLKISEGTRTPYCGICQCLNYLYQDGVIADFEHLFALRLLYANRPAGKSMYEYYFDYGDKQSRIDLINKIINQLKNE